MKKLVALLLISLTLSVSSYAQADATMIARLNKFMQFNRDLDFENLMDYLYPKIFTIAPKEQFIEVFKSTFSGNEEVSVEMDSLQTGNISTLITVEKGSYYLIRYDMLLRMKLKKQGDDDQSGANSTMLATMKEQYGENNVRFDESSGKFVIKIQTSMVAIKDELSPEWTFLNFEPEHPLSAKLLDEPVITKLKAFRKEQKN